MEHNKNEVTEGEFEASSNIIETFIILTIFCFVFFNLEFVIQCSKAEQKKFFDIPGPTTRPENCRIPSNSCDSVEAVFQPKIFWIFSK